MATILTTINTHGEVSTRVVPINCRKQEAMDLLGISSFGPMDEFGEKVHGDKFVITMRIAQDRPWTWMTYIFVQ